MQMKKINLEIIAPKAMDIETLYEVLFQRGISNTRLDDGQGNIMELEMSQVIGNTNSVVLSAKKVCTSEVSDDKIESPTNKGESYAEETEASNTVCNQL